MKNIFSFIALSADFRRLITRLLPGSITQNGQNGCFWAIFLRTEIDFSFPKGIELKNVVFFKKVPGNN